VSTIIFEPARAITANANLIQSERVRKYAAKRTIAVAGNQDFFMT
jgi:hypothetical protein